MQYSGGKYLQGKRWARTMGDQGRGQRWVEPFAGGLGAYLGAGHTYESALLADLSPIASMWQCVQRGWVPDPSPITKDEFNAARTRAWRPYPAPQDVYLAHAGAVAGSPRKGHSLTDRVGPGIAGLRRVQALIQRPGVDIRQQDYRASLAECGRNDVVYLDPPYNHDKNWIAPAKFDFDEMLGHTYGALALGATVFVSTYDRELDPRHWVLVNGHLDAAVRSSGAASTVVLHRQEFPWARVVQDWNHRTEILGADTGRPAPDGGRPHRAGHYSERALGGRLMCN